MPSSAVRYRNPFGVNYPFGPSSVWKTPVDQAPLSPDTNALVAHLAGTVNDRYIGVAAFNAHQFNNSFYVASSRTPRVDVAFTDCQHKGYVPQGLYGPRGQFLSVPIPPGAVPASGSDAELSIYDPETDQLWEFWVAQKNNDGTWAACWGGRIDQASSSLGYFAAPFGATATGLANSGGMVSLADVRSGSIDHAISLDIPGPKRNQFSWPAQRGDGVDDSATAVPEGTRLRLDPSLDVDSMHLSPVGAMIARAAQRYGFIVVDNAGAVAVIAQSGADEQARTGVDPWRQLLAGTPDYLVMRNFPWTSLQALPQNYGR